MKNTTTIVALLALLATGCLQTDPAPRFTPAWEKFDPEEEKGWTETTQALLISDCQLHNLYSRALPDRNLSVEAMAGTAIRPPQLDLFADEVLEWVLRNGAPEAKVILHLGDAMDLSSEGEFELFVATMAKGGRPWFMAPGNHDGYYFGSYSPQDESLWEAACYESGEVLTKDLFIRAYVAALLGQESPGIASFRDALGVRPKQGESLLQTGLRLPDSFEWRAGETTAGNLVSICWEIDAEHPWRSYILQSVSVSDAASGRAVTTILMDSCQYGRMPELIPNAWQSYPLPLNCGFAGEMLPNQLRKVREWIESGGGRMGFVLACHHPFDKLAPRTRSSLGWLWRENELGLMVTSHTHAGFFAYHELGGDQAELELNIGSTTDWPMEWRTLQAFRNEAGGRIYLQAKRYTLVDSLIDLDGYFLREWEVPVDAPDDYRKYKLGEPAPGLLVDFYLAHHLVPRILNQPKITPNSAAEQTEERVKDTLLWTYVRLMDTFPTDPADATVAWPTGCSSDAETKALIATYTDKSEALEEKVGLLIQLEAFESSRDTADPKTRRSTNEERFRFKISQAAWAARYEKEQGRQLRLEDELIRVERRK